MIRADLVLGLCLAASAARGQVFNEPKYFGWLDPPETASATERPFGSRDGLEPMGQRRAASSFAVRAGLGMAPTKASTTSPPLTIMSAGMDWTPKRSASSG